MTKRKAESDESGSEPYSNEALGAEPYLAVHHFYTQGGVDTYDEEGELLLGHYWQVMKDEKTPLCKPVGPYSDFNEAVEAGRHAFATKAY